MCTGYRFDTICSRFSERVFRTNGAGLQYAACFETGRFVRFGLISSRRPPLLCLPDKRGLLVSLLVLTTGLTTISLYMCYATCYSKQTSSFEVHLKVRHLMVNVIMQDKKHLRVSNTTILRGPVSVCIPSTNLLFSCCKRQDRLTSASIWCVYY